jgi:hypothetical protein
MKKFSFVFLTLLVSLISVGCQSVAEHRDAIRDEKNSKVTAANVQKSIRIGMYGAEVIDVLGAPNIITTDSQRREVWVYDKFTTETAYSTSQGGVAALILTRIDQTAPTFGAGTAEVGGTTGATVKTQRTLTVVIRFDKASKVRDFSYNTSSF